MKRTVLPLFTFVVIALFSFTTKAQVYDAPSTFHGSLLCGEKVIHITRLPAKLRTFQLKDKVIIPDTVFRTITIRYYYETPVIIMDPLPGDTIRLDTTVMNPYFRKDNRYIAPNPQWEVVHKYYLNGDSASPDKVEFGNPFMPCVNFKYNCDELNVYRHILREICPSWIAKLTKSYTIKDDTITAIFTDTLIPQSVVCLAEGYYPKTDTITIPLKGLPSSPYLVEYEQIVKQKVECLVAPCPDSTSRKGIVDIADLSKCVHDGIENTTDASNAPILYPNPASDKLYLKGVEGVVTLINTLGVSYMLTGTGEYSLKGLPTGVYTATYRLNGVEHRQKLVVY